MIIIITIIIIIIIMIMIKIMIMIMKMITIIRVTDLVQTIPGAVMYTIYEGESESFFTRGIC